MKVKNVLVLTFFCLFIFCNTLQATEYGQVEKCYDGDTFRLKDGRVVRLAGIDAPETAKKDHKAQYYANESYLLLKSLIEGKRVNIAPEGGKTTFEFDDHKRLVGEVFFENGKSLNELLVQEGAAFLYVHPTHPKAFIDRLLAAQLTAMNNKAGFWNRLLNEDFAKNTYTGNKNSKRFFPDDCIYKERISPRNRIKFSSLYNAFASGYAPARNCAFWPEL